MLKPFLSARETNVAHAQGSRITGVSGEAGTGTRQALTAASRRSERAQAACQPRTACPAQHQPPFCLAAFGMLSLPRYLELPGFTCPGCERHLGRVLGWQPRDEQWGRASPGSGAGEQHVFPG